MSDDVTYRYLLERSWASGRGRVLWVGLNPSTADDRKEDPTTRRIRAFSRKAGFQAFSLVNLYARRATNPRMLNRTAVEIGPDNHVTVRTELARCDLVVAAWGAHPAAKFALPPMLAALRESGRGVMCYGVTVDGSPRHPLYLPGDALLRPWRIP